MARSRDISKVLSSNTTLATDAEVASTYATQADFSNTLWTTFTPTTSDMTIGNGTFDCKYKQIGKLVYVSYKFTRGSTSSFSSGMAWSVPVTPKSANGSIFMTSLVDANGSYSFGHAWFTGTSVQHWVCLVNSTYPNWNYVNNTTPFTWDVSDSINFHMFYEAA
jgi:hypothetical protein